MYLHKILMMTRTCVLQLQGACKNIFCPGWDLKAAADGHLVKVVVYITVSAFARLYTVQWVNTFKGCSIQYRTGLVVQALARPEWLVEIDATAVIPD